MCPKGLTPEQEEAATLSSFLRFYSSAIHAAMLKLLPCKFQGNLLFPIAKRFTFFQAAWNLWPDFTLRVKTALSPSFPGETWILHIKMTAVTFVCTILTWPQRGRPSEVVLTRIMICRCFPPKTLDNKYSSRDFSKSEHRLEVGW